MTQSGTREMGMTQSGTREVGLVQSGIREVRVITIRNQGGQDVHNEEPGMG